MTARAKLHILLAAFAFASLAAWGGRDVLAGLFDPILRSLGA